MNCIIIKNDERTSMLMDEYLREKGIFTTIASVNCIPALKNALLFKSFDYAIIDFATDCQDVFETARIVKRYSQRTQCVICIDPSAFKIDFLIHFDISGYLSVRHSLDELMRCFELMKEGYRYICEEIRQKLSLIEHIRDEHISANDHLTKQEKKILRLLITGRSTSEIAKELFVSTNTVNNHKTNIRNKLRLTSNRQLVFYAMNHTMMLNEAVA